VLSHGGIPSVAFGPGGIAQAAHGGSVNFSRSPERGKDLIVSFLKSLP